AIVPTLVSSLRAIAADKAATLKELEAAKLHSLTGRGESLTEVQSLASLAEQARGTQEETELRRRLKAALGWLIEEIWVQVQVFSRLSRVAHVHLFFRTGQRKYLQILSGPLAPGSAVWDLAADDPRTRHVGGVAGDAEPRPQLVG